MGFDIFVIAPLLPSHCGFSFVFGCGISFLVSSSVFLSMIVQQLVVIPVPEGVSECPSTPPSSTNLYNSFFQYGKFLSCCCYLFLFCFVFIFHCTGVLKSSGQLFCGMFLNLCLPFFS